MTDQTATGPEPTGPTATGPESTGPTVTASEPTGSEAARTFPCVSCGAQVHYAPGTDVLRCPYCGATTQVPQQRSVVVEHSITELAQRPRVPAASLGAQSLTCQKCGATTQSEELSRSCPFCGAPVVVRPDPDLLIPPEAVLPFGLDRAAMRAALRGWVRTRHFAPSKLKKVSEAESTTGLYLPHWTFDAGTVSQYQGQRGEYYWVTETYTVTVNGQTQTRTRQVRRTRWWPASGTVSRAFDDVLVPGTTAVDSERLADVAPWPMEGIQPYAPGYLSGFRTVRYDVEPEVGLAAAKEQMGTVIVDDCRRDIGGDEQRVFSVRTQYDDVSFKLVLLPVWSAVYLFRGRSWHVMINGCTGEVHGERPYSAVKIILTILLALIVIAAIVGLIVLAN